MRLVRGLGTSTDYRGQLSCGRVAGSDIRAREISREARYTTAVFVWPWSSGDTAIAVLQSVFANAQPNTPVILPAGEHADQLVDAIVVRTGARPASLTRTADASFASAMNQAFRASIGTNLAVIADACRTPKEWLERLRSAAWIDDTVAASTALASGAGDPVFGGFDLQRVPSGLQRASGHEAGPDASPLRPRISRLWPHCTLIRRSAFELVGSFDESLTHPAAVLADFAARAVARGLSCVLADDVWVERMDDGLPSCPEGELSVLFRRYPWQEIAREQEAALDPGPLRRSLIAARARRRLPSVTIDARALGPTVGGTQTYVAALVLALAKSDRLAVRAIVAADAPPDAVEAFAESGVEVASYEEATVGLPRTDVVHRPQQVFTPDDLRLVLMLGERTVISQLDLIAYRNPTYHATPDAWQAYRRTTRLALAVADRVLFFSEHARNDAVAEDLIEPVRTAIAGIGVEREGRRDGSRRPEGVPAGRDIVLMLGANYLHKNRLFGLELADELRRRHGWDGLLVMAGAHVPHGSSSAAEAELLHARPELATRVLDLGSVPDPEKSWLVEHAQAQLCPSTYEGFGLIPLEAAAAGSPCIYAACTSFGEVVGPEAATIVPWDAAASADSAVALLQDGEPRARHVALLSRALDGREWEHVVERLCDVYLDVIASPYRASAPRSHEELRREELIVELDGAYRDLKDRVVHGMPLIDRGGLLTRAQQRGLMRVASRRWLKGPLLGPFAIIGNRERKD